MPRLIPVDGSQGETSGQVLRTALCLAAATGQGFEMTRIRATRPRPGLRPQQVATLSVGLITGLGSFGLVLLKYVQRWRATKTQE